MRKKHVKAMIFYLFIWVLSLAILPGRDCAYASETYAETDVSPGGSDEGLSESEAQYPAKDETGQGEDALTQDGADILSETAKETFSLYSEKDEWSAACGSWEEVVKKINDRKRQSHIYTVSVAGDCQLPGALKMPDKKNYAGLILTGDGSVSAGGALTMTGALTLGEQFRLQVKSISGASYTLTLSDAAVLDVRGGATVKNLSLQKDSGVNCGGKLTVKNLLSAGEGVKLTLAEKKYAAIQNTELLSEEAIEIRIRNSSGEFITLPQGTVLLSVSGSSYANRFRLRDAQGEEQALFRKGKAIKVQGGIGTPFELIDRTQEGISYGRYETLSDVAAEVNRRKDSAAVYEIRVHEASFVKGGLPLPGAKKYKRLIFTGEALSVTGNLTLTGDLCLEIPLCRVKSATDKRRIAATVNLSKYRLEITPGNEIPDLGSITGSAGSVLEIKPDAVLEVSGNFKSDKLVLGGTLSVGGTVTVTDVTALPGNRLNYDIAKAVSVKGNVEASEAKLEICPMKDRKEVSSFPEGIRLMSNVPKADVGSFMLAQGKINAFYRDGKALKLGMPRLVLFEGRTDYETCQADKASAQFVTINDLIDYVNRSDETDFVARLNLIIPSVGKMPELKPGKHLILCGKKGEKMTLQFTGGITLNGSSLEVRRLFLDNKTAAGAPVVLRNGASLLLENTAVGSFKGDAGTTLRLIGEIDFGGALTGASDLFVQQDAAVRVNGGIAARNLTLLRRDGGEGAPNQNSAQLNLSEGKKLVLSESVKTTGKDYFRIDLTDKNGTLAKLGVNTVMVSVPDGRADQFKTDNIMPGTFLEWSLVKIGNNIQTTETNEGDGEWSGDYL